MMTSLQVQFHTPLTIPYFLKHEYTKWNRCGHGLGNYLNGTRMGWQGPKRVNLLYVQKNAYPNDFRVGSIRFRRFCVQNKLESSCPFWVINLIPNKRLSICGFRKYQLLSSSPINWDGSDPKLSGQKVAPIFQDRTHGSDVSKPFS